MPRGALVSAFRTSLVPVDEWDSVGLPTSCEAFAGTAGAVELEGRTVRVRRDLVAIGPVRVRIGQEVVDLPVGALLEVVPGQRVEAGARVAWWNANYHPILAIGAGRVRFSDWSDETTEVDVTGRRSIVRARRGGAEFTVSLVVDEQVVQHHWLPPGSAVTVEDGASVVQGETLAMVAGTRIRLPPPRPLPSPREQLERWVDRWTGGTHAEHPLEAAYGVVKVMADLPVGEVLAALPEALRAAVRSLSVPTQETYGMGAPMHALWFNVHEVQHVAQGRFEAGLLALRAFERERR